MRCRPGARSRRRGALVFCLAGVDRSLARGRCRDHQQSSAGRSRGRRSAAEELPLDPRWRRGAAARSHSRGGRGADGGQGDQLLPIAAQAAPGASTHLEGRLLDPRADGAAALSSVAERFGRRDRAGVRQGKIFARRRAGAGGRALAGDPRGWRRRTRGDRAAPRVRWRRAAGIAASATAGRERRWALGGRARDRPASAVARLASLDARSCARRGRRRTQPRDGPHANLRARAQTTARSPIGC